MATGVVPDAWPGFRGFGSGNRSVPQCAPMFLEPHWRSHSPRPPSNRPTTKQSTNPQTPSPQFPLDARRRIPTGQRHTALWLRRSLLLAWLTSQTHRLDLLPGACRYEVGFPAVDSLSQPRFQDRECPRFPRCDSQHHLRLSPDRRRPRQPAHDP